MNAKERVMGVLNHQKPDRMPCFGANSTVTYEQMEKVQAFWPQGHENGEIMAKQAMAAYTVLGFDAVRVPFSQTFEAEALGCKLKPGRAIDGSEGIPGIDHPPPFTLDDPIEFPDDFLSRGKIPELLKAVRILKEEAGDEVPVVGGIIGPFTIAAALVDMVPLLKASIKTPEKMRPILDVAEHKGLPRNLFTLVFPDRADIPSISRAYASLPYIARAEPNYITPELLDLNDLDTGQYQGMVLQDPNDRRNIQGFVYLSLVFVWWRRTDRSQQKRTLRSARSGIG